MNLLNQIQNGHRFRWTPTNDRTIELHSLSLTGQIAYRVFMDDEDGFDPSHLSSVDVATFERLLAIGAYIPAGTRDRPVAPHVFTFEAERPLETESNTSSEAQAE